MFIAFIIGALLGFILAMPPGPVGVVAIRLGLSGSVKPGTFMAYGTASMDVVFCTLVIFATSAVKGAVSSFSEQHPVIMLISQIIIILGFVLFGIINLRYKNNRIDIFDESQDIHHSKFIENLKQKGPFLLGVAIALTNIPNPTFLPTLTYITLQIHAVNFFETTVLSNLAFAIGFGIGNFSWLYTLVRVINRYKAKMSTAMIARIKQFAGVTFIGFGTYLGWRLIPTLHLPEFLRFVVVF